MGAIFGRLSRRAGLSAIAGLSCWHYVNFITLFNTVHCDGQNLTRRSNCDEGVTSYDLRVEKLELTPLCERILRAKGGPNRTSIDSSEKHWMMVDYQLTVLLVEVIRTTFFENLQPAWDVHVRIHVAPLACYPFINIKLAAYHLLLYVVFIFAKNHKILFMHSFVTSKNVKWCHLICTTLYKNMYLVSHKQSVNYREFR